jgi:hypothetical protein
MSRVLSSDIADVAAMQIQSNGWRYALLSLAPGATNALAKPVGD